MADPASLTCSYHLPGLCYAHRSMGGYTGLHVHLYFAPFGLRDNSHSPGGFQSTPEGDPLLCNTCRENKTSPMHAPTPGTETVFSFADKVMLHSANVFSLFLFQAFNYFCIELMWNYMSLDNVNNAWDLRQTHERSLFFMSNNFFIFYGTN